MRVQVNISEEMLRKVDEYARKIGVSRSSLCSVLIGQGIMNYEKSADLLRVIGDKVGESLIAEKMIEKVAKGREFDDGKGF